ncbi:hypothetical protein [Pseudoalteromonas holothuriae]|nr:MULTISPECIES: hypothetical protein [unclassified Pseudoalteromonas]
MNSDYGSVDILNDYLYKHYQGSRFSSVNRHSGGRKSMSCDVFIAAIDYLNVDEFVALFYQVSWDKPEEAQLMIKTQGQVTFTLYQAKI